MENVSSERRNMESIISDWDVRLLKKRTLILVHTSSVKR